MLGQVARQPIHVIFVGDALWPRTHQDGEHTVGQLFVQRPPAFRCQRGDVDPFVVFFLSKIPLNASAAGEEAIRWIVEPRFGVAKAKEKVSANETLKVKRTEKAAS